MILKSTKQLYPFKITWVADLKSFISALLTRCVDPATHFHSRLELKLLKSVQLFPVFKMGSKLLLLFFLYSNASAESLVPPSYFAIEKCWPELLDPQFKKSISLEKLREKIDTNWGSRKKVNLLKVWTLKDVSGVRKRLILKTKPAPPASVLKDAQSLSLEKLDQNNSGEALSLPIEHRVNPTQKIINSYLVSSEIEQEETETLDIKVNNLELRLRSLKNGLQNLKLQDLKSQKTLRCEVSAQVGLVCLCLKK